MIKIKKTTTSRKKRVDPIILLRQKYEGNVWSSPKVYNRAFANVLREMADAIAKVDDAWVDPEVIVWMHQPGEITAEVPLSPTE
jgi:hypothetical protein